MIDQRSGHLTDPAQTEERENSARLRKYSEDQRTQELIRVSAAYAVGPRNCRFSQAELQAFVDEVNLRFRTAQDHARTQDVWTGVERRKAAR